MLLLLPMWSVALVLPMWFGDAVFVLGSVVVVVAGVNVVDGVVAVIIKYVVYLVSRSLTITMDSMQQLGLVADPS